LASWSSCTPLHGEALDEVLQVFFTQALVGAIQAHYFKKPPAWTYRPCASGFGQVERLANLANDQSKRLERAAGPRTLQGFEPGPNIQCLVPLPVVVYRVLSKKLRIETEDVEKRFGKVPESALGAGGRAFKSPRPDH
jgi:hypothetical protein